MEEIKEKLKHLIEVKKISAIQLLCEEVGLTQDELISVLKEMIEASQIEGHLSDDQSRFFLKLNIPEHPSRAEDEPPAFLQYNTRPGKIVAILGLIILIFAAVLRVIVAGNVTAENVFYILSFIGIAIMFSGCYYIGKRQTP